jgi:hypothetical protein
MGLQTHSFVLMIRFSSEFMSQVEDGTIEITVIDLPSFLYETGTLYNHDNEMSGLFRGYLLVRVCFRFDFFCLPDRYLRSIAIFSQDRHRP